MSTVDPAKLPEMVAAALVRLIKVCANHDIPIGDLLARPDARRIAQLEMENQRLTTSMAKATTELIKLRRKIADYEEI